MFDDLFDQIEQELIDASGSCEAKDVLERCASKIFESLNDSEVESIKKLVSDRNGFDKRTYQRWKEGFQKLEMLCSISLEAGMEFQKHFLTFPKFETDPLLGVLMRQHANACRITGEINVLLQAGYPDGALASAHP